MEAKEIRYLKACLAIETERPTDNRNNQRILEYIEELEQLAEIGTMLKTAFSDLGILSIGNWEDNDYCIRNVAQLKEWYSEFMSK